MKPSSRRSIAVFSVCLGAFIVSPCLAMISVGFLTKEKAKEKYGITMHAHADGEAGIKVWLDFKKEGWLEKLTYVQLRFEDTEGKPLITAPLHAGPVDRSQPDGMWRVAFSAKPEQLSRCSFLVVCYNSNEGDVGYYLKVKDFLDLKNPITEE